VPQATNWTLISYLSIWTAGSPKLSHGLWDNLLVKNSTVCWTLNRSARPIDSGVDFVLAIFFES
jgi:hypothetical protein